MFVQDSRRGTRRLGDDLTDSVSGYFSDPGTPTVLWEAAIGLLLIAYGLSGLKKKAASYSKRRKSEKRKRIMARTQKQLAAL